MLIAIQRPTENIDFIRATDELRGNDEGRNRRAAVLIISRSRFAQSLSRVTQSFPRVT